MNETWTAIDRSISNALIPFDATLNAVLEENAAAGLPPHDVSPPQGKLLMLIARMCGARSILEVGTLGGYSTIWLARGLAPGGRVVTLEANEHHARVAAVNFERAGLGDRIQQRVGRAIDILPLLVNEGPFDLFFIDADKASNAAYLAWCLRLARVGSVIIVDNVVRDGAVIDPSSVDPSVAGIRATYEWFRTEPRVDATAIQTVGTKGHDGFAIATVIS